MDTLPSEVILYILTFLDPRETVHLQLVSRRFLRLARDNIFWRSKCFENSSWEGLRRRRQLIASAPARGPWFRDLQAAPYNKEPEARQGIQEADHRDLRTKTTERLRILANWDPSYPKEKVDWYSEFIHRSAPITISWLQQPRNRQSTEREPMEVRGAGIYNPIGEETSVVVAPLDDGSVCLWDVTSNSTNQGRILGRSAPNTLSTSGSSSEVLRSRMISTGVTECVSVDSHRKHAFIAVQSELVEVDLETLHVVSREKFPFSISAISEAKYTTPITVGTTLSLHMHDPRASDVHLATSDSPEQLEEAIPLPRASVLRNIYDPQPINYAPLFHPGPLSILHLSTSGDSGDGNGDIYVAGRFSSILNYDRRYFPRLRGTIHSGASLCSMTSIPQPFGAEEKDRMRRAELSIEQVDAAKASPGNTLVACGEYKTKGSLELYGLSTLPYLTTMASDYSVGKPQYSDFLKNRQTSSSSKLLSVSNHGTRIVFSDSEGNIKWVERDGFTAVRQWNISQGCGEGPRGIWRTLMDFYTERGSGDIVRKILHTRTHAGKYRTPISNDNLVLWTGEHLGLLTFSNKPSFAADSFEHVVQSVEEVTKEREERAYAKTMRKALQQQADEVRFVRGLGFGVGS